MSKKNKFKNEIVRFCTTIDGIRAYTPAYFETYIKKAKLHKKIHEQVKSKYFIKKNKKLFIKTAGIEVMDKLRDSEAQFIESVGLIPTSQYVTLFIVFENYIRQIIKASLSENKTILIQTENNISLNEILEFSTIKEVVNFSIEREVDDALRDKKSIVDWIKENLKINVPNVNNLNDDFVKYNGIRNLLVHNNGKVNRIYLQNCLQAKFDKKDLPKIGDNVDVTPDLFLKTCSNLYLIGLQIGINLWIHSKPKDIKLIENLLIDQQIKFLNKRKFYLAEIVSNMAISTIKTFSKIPIEENVLINKAASLKFQKKDNLSEQILNNIHSKDIVFNLAICLINKNFKTASALMTKINKSKLQSYYINWPLFKLNRRSETLNKAFKKIVGKVSLYQIQ